MFGADTNFTNFEVILIWAIFMCVNTAVAYLIGVKKWKILGPISGIFVYIGTFIILIWGALDKYYSEKAAKRAIDNKEISRQQ